MAFEENPKQEDPHIEEARRRARHAYIKPFMDAIRVARPKEVDVTAA